MTGKDLPVRGHLCDGLRAFQRDGGGCTPRFKANGIVTACDDENDIPLTHCPFCGTAFEGATEPSCGYEGCDCTPESHQWRRDQEAEMRKLDDDE